MLPVLAACDAGTTACDAGEACDGTGGSPNPTATCPAPDSDFTRRDSSELFDAPSVPRFDLYLPEQAWADLQKNAQDEEYVEAFACFDGRAIGTVGMRFKGAYGSLYSCFETGVNLCRKLGIKLKFDKYDPDLRFFGLKRLNFHGYRWDDTYIRERLAYDLYREMDIVAPRVSWAVLRVNDEVLGLYGMVEQIDGRFTDNRWPDNGDGNLYKEAWPVRPDPEWVLSKLETNEEVGNIDAFLDFAEAMTDAEPDALRSTLAGYMDLDAFARYMAVDDAIINSDGITTFYTTEDATWSGNHNFYFYEESPTRFTLIPWDLESTLMRNSGFGNVPRWTEKPDDCSLSYPVWGGISLALAPGCDPLFRALAQDLTEYRKAGEELLDGPFSEAAMLAAIDQHVAFIRDEAAADPNGPGLTIFEGALSELRQEIPALRARFARLLSGETWKPVAIDPTAVTGFEDQDDFGLVDGSVLVKNPNSTFTVSVNRHAPMRGEQELLMSFDFRNEVDPWQQWAVYGVPLSTGAHDVRSLTGLRLWVRSDQTRTLRLDLDSPESSERDAGIRIGWDIVVTEEAREVEVSFSNARVADWVTAEGRDPGDDPNDILRTVSGLFFAPQCVGRGDSGQLPEGTSDSGFVAIDDIEFF
ncbi:MAG: CotH kinase family protein [Pseudomonadota bacterium]